MSELRNSRYSSWIWKRQRNQRTNYQLLLDHRKSKGIPEKKKNKKQKTFSSLTTLKPLTVDHNKLWKILKEIGIPEHFTCLLRNLYAGQEARVRTRHGTADWFHIGKGVHQGCMLAPCLFYDPTDTGNLTSGSSAFSKSSLNTIFQDLK